MATHLVLESLRQSARETKYEEKVKEKKKKVNENKSIVIFDILFLFASSNRFYLF